MDESEFDKARQAIANIKDQRTVWKAEKLLALAMDPNRLIEAEKIWALEKIHKLATQD